MGFDIISKYFTSVLTVLIFLNLALLIFLVMDVGLKQIIDVPFFIFKGLQDPEILRETDQLLTRKTVSTAPSDSGHGIKTVSGVVDDPNIKFVSSDETFAAAAAKVRPAMVSISSEDISPAPRIPGIMQFDDPSSDLQTLGGIGSGMIVDSKGYILTCAHIIANATNIFVTPFGPEEKKYNAHLIAKDDNLNLALLKMNTSSPLPVVSTGKSAQMEVADMVLAIGCPFGLEQSVTHGIVSDNSRDLLINGRIYREMMQTDAPVNRGSSGGPLVNIYGEVVGINMAIYSPTGVYNGISFALPIDQAKPFLAKAIP